MPIDPKTGASIPYRFGRAAREAADTLREYRGPFSPQDPLGIRTGAEAGIALGNRILEAGRDVGAGFMMRPSSNPAASDPTMSRMVEEAQARRAAPRVPAGQEAIAAAAAERAAAPAQPTPPPGMPPEMARVWSGIQARAHQPRELTPRGMVEGVQVGSQLDRDRGVEAARDAEFDAIVQDMEARSRQQDPMRRSLEGAKMRAMYEDLAPVGEGPAFSVENDPRTGTPLYRNIPQFGLRRGEAADLRSKLAIEEARIGGAAAADSARRQAVMRELETIEAEVRRMTDEINRDTEHSPEEKAAALDRIDAWRNLRETALGLRQRETAG